MMLYVWYSPERDDLRVNTKESGFLFKDKVGIHHLCYEIFKPNAFLKHYEYYLIGKFGEWDLNEIIASEKAL